MPVCSYLVSPVNGKRSELEDTFGEMSECDYEKAENRDLYILVTETEDMSHQKELEDTLQNMDQVSWLVQTFGEITEGSDPVKPESTQ